MIDYTNMFSHLERVYHFDNNPSFELDPDIEQPVVYLKLADNSELTPCTRNTKC